MSPVSFAGLLLGRNISLSFRDVSLPGFSQGSCDDFANQCANSVVVYGESFAGLTAKQYTYVFIGCDVVSLCLQGISIQTLIISQARP